MKQENLYLIWFILLTLIFSLCLCRYNGIKKERYFNSMRNNNVNGNNNINGNININGNNNVFVPTDAQREEKRKYGCTGKEFDKKMGTLYTDLDMYQKTYQQKQDTLHQYEELSDKLVDIKKQLIKSEESVKSCIPNFSEKK